MEKKMENDMETGILVLGCSLQGMNSSFYSQKTNSDANFWGRWSGKKEGRESGVNAQDAVAHMLGHSPLQ